MLISLSCWTCRKSIDVEVPGPPQFAFEVAGWANDVGWIGTIDLRRYRSLVFCSSDCQCAAKTKAGHYRARRLALPLPEVGE